jgi:hypothetical protein
MMMYQKNFILNVVGQRGEAPNKRIQQRCGDGRERKRKLQGETEFSCWERNERSARPGYRIKSTVHQNLERNTK